MNTREIAKMALFIALGVVFSRFLSIQTPFVLIGFSFIPNILSSIYLGPLLGGIVNAMIDFIGAILFPKGTYFPGFTISALISGLIYGIFLYKRNKSIINISLAVITRIVVVSLFLNVIWLKILTGKAYFVIMSSRLTNDLIMLPIQIIIIKSLYEYFERNKFGDLLSN